MQNQTFALVCFSIKKKGKFLIHFQEWRSCSVPEDMSLIEFVAAVKRGNPKEMKVTTTEERISIVASSSSYLLRTSMSGRLEMLLLSWTSIKRGDIP